ncbi:WD40/YVTN/BNR-like repeat-containing protein [Olivibacter domesticus]|uniref:Photosynthesis system II assembly factor Ycf48/Hcf136-like domain-containing protein n=1 Tax=Olivibacter domesticus TaxID=407022 RepID=A0A1H7UV46_OLID1|nr:YCF48-related protein [Olivibacter domesticus]SEM00706.1 Uncharacterized protein SAMN05661044_03956 [Olivibacter domesticus]
MQYYNLVIRYYFGISMLLAFIFIISCKKDEKPVDQPDTEINPPGDFSVKMEIIKGADQVGYFQYDLPDTVIIKVTPKNPEDLEKYSVRIGNQPDRPNYAIRLAAKNADDTSIYFKYLWKLEENTKPEAVFYTYFNCADDIFYIGGCKALDSIKVSATVKEKWLQLYANNNSYFQDMVFLDSLHGIASSDWRGLFKTADGGNTWVQDNGSFSGSARSDTYNICFFDNKIGLVEVTNDYAYFTSDGGQNFEFEDWQPPIGGHRSVRDFYMTDANTIFAVGNNGAILKSITKGKSWQKYNGFTFINNLRSVVCLDKNHCYACGDVGKILRTDDGGEKWTELPINLNNNLYTIYLINQNEALIGGQGGALIKTTDGGQTWQRMYIGIGTDILAIRFFDSKRGVVVGAYGEIASTVDGGSSWKTEMIANYGASNLSKAVIKDEHTVFALNNYQILRYDLNLNP